MKQKNIILDKSFVFSVRVVKVYKYLNGKENHVKSLQEDIEKITKLLTSIIKSSQVTKLIKQYALKQSNQPIGVATYEVTEKLPENLKEYLPTSKEIEQNILNLMEEDNLKLDNNMGIYVANQVIKLMIKKVFMLL